MTTNEATREQLIQQLFITTHGDVRNRLTSDPWIVPITARAVESSIAALANHVHQYEGPLTEDEFVAWCVEQSTQASRIETLYERYNKVVLKGAWSILKTSMDLGADDAMARDVAADAWASFILKGHLDRLTHEKGLVAWFYKVGRNAGLAWRTDRLRHRERHSITLDVAAQRRGVGFNGYAEDIRDPRSKRSLQQREKSWDDVLMETVTDPALEAPKPTEQVLAAD